MKLLADKKLSLHRYSICKMCENLRSITKTCKICNCIMPLKVKLISSECPIGKWKSPTNSWSS
jgi:hypothetical protein